MNIIMKKANAQLHIKSDQRRTFFIGIICLLIFGLAIVSARPAVAAKKAEKVYTNRLIKSFDPYLLLHAHNPVDWYPWGAEALKKARKEDKPIFVSIGYSTCYWCHVAERELYSDPVIAQLMNKWFVNIKVDREERPDIDALYMSARGILTGRGGWPNNLFLTPRLKPFFAGSYFPPAAGSGRPGFSDILKGIHKAWTGDRSRVEQVAEEVYTMLQKSEDGAGATSDKSIDIGKWVNDSLDEAARAFDEAEGGFGAGPTKFPKAPLLSMLLEAYSNNHNNKKPLDMVTRTLTAMASGGIMDQLGGGFHRYSTESTWSVPHFEKMLYDNAQLLGIYARAYALTKKPLFRDVALRTASYLSNEMEALDGGFYSAQDAESEGVEGASYVWTREEIEAVLNEKEAQRFFDLYALTPMPSAPLGHRQTPGGVLRIKAGKARGPAASNDLAAAIKSLRPMRKKLLDLRNAGTQPARDEKIVTADNALTVIGLTGAGEGLGAKVLTKRAVKTARLLWERAYNKETGELTHQFFNGHAGGLGFLDDYALLGQAFIGIFNSTGDELWLTRARAVADSMLDRFTLRGGALTMSRDKTLLFVVTPSMGDLVKPSGRSAAIGLLLDLAASSNEARYSEAALRALKPLTPLISARPAAWAFLLSRLGRPRLRRALDAALKEKGFADNKNLSGSAAHVRATAKWSASGDEREVLVRVNIDAGYHINANPPSAPYLVATELLAEGYPGVKVDYPTSKVFKAAFAVEGIAVYDGIITIRGRLPRALTNVQPALSLRVQACNAALCLAPELIRVESER